LGAPDDETRVSASSDPLPSILIVNVRFSRVVMDYF
jgi:hypothetical protein